MQCNKKLVTEVNVREKVVFLRVDFNVPIVNGEITSTKRIDLALPTIKYLLDQKAKIVILSHLGRPKSQNDINSGNFSLKPVAKVLSEKLSSYVNQVIFVNRNKGFAVEQKIRELKPSDILFLENTRFNDISAVGISNFESDCDEDLAQYWAKLCDVFINDAFGAAHRKHASTYGIAKYAKEKAIGFLMAQEISNISKVLNNPIKPMTIIFGGAKVSDKIKAVKSAIEIADKVIISGGMAYTFLKALGYNMGNSNVEPQYFELVKGLYKENKDKIIISSDFMCSKTFSNEYPIYKTRADGLAGLYGLDIGKKSIEEFSKVVKESNSIIWNGPMGVTEFPNFEIGTRAIAEEIYRRTKLGAYTIIGGGDSAAAAEKLGQANAFSWISTGGGATLSLIENKKLVAIEPIEESKIAKKQMNVEKYVLDPKYQEEYIRTHSQYFATFKPIELKKTISRTELIELANANIKEDKNKQPIDYLKKTTKVENDIIKPANPYDFDLGQEDPLAIYDSGAPIIEPVVETVVVKKPTGTSLEELERLARLKKKSISASGLKIRALIKEKNMEMELINKIKNSSTTSKSETTEKEEKTNKSTSKTTKSKK